MPALRGVSFVPETEPIAALNPRLLFSPAGRAFLGPGVPLFCICTLMFCALPLSVIPLRSGCTYIKTRTLTPELGDFSPCSGIAGFPQQINFLHHDQATEFPTFFPPNPSPTISRLYHDSCTIPNLKALVSRLRASSAFDRDDLR